MKTSKNPLPDINLLKQVFKKYPEIQTVYLFGSQAEDRSRSDSDIDLAVVSASEIHPKKVDILSELAEFGFCQVDLIFLDQADLVLKYEVVRLNKVIYQRPEFDKGGYYSMVLREYFDFYPYLEVQREAYKRRILSDSKGSYSKTPE